MTLQCAEGVRVGELCSRQELLIRVDEYMSARRVSRAASQPRCLDSECTKRSSGPQGNQESGLYFEGSGSHLKVFNTIGEGCSNDPFALRESFFLM